MEDWLTAQRRVRPDHLALTFQGRVWSYSQLDEQVNATCARLSSLGIHPGEVLAVHLPNSPMFVMLIHAAARLGLVLAPLNTRLTAPELNLQLERLGARVFISDFLEPGSLITAGFGCKILTPNALDALPLEQFRGVSIELDKVQAVVFTSGTSGMLKGAVVTFGQLFWSALGSAFRLGVKPDDRWLSVLPLYHVGGLAVVFRSCLYGTTISLHAGFQSDMIARSLQEEQNTLISLVPTMLRRLLAANVVFPESLRLVLLGGAAAPLDLMAECAHRKLPIAVTYGLTEAASQVATMPPGSAMEKPGCVGKPLLWNQIKIIDEQDSELPSGEIGEICVSGPVVMPGYWHDTLATRKALRNGWLHTGDLGYLDGDGDLWVVQRRTDLIISGGENIYPAEIEAVLREHNAVEDACVVGIPDHEWGQRVAAAVVVEPDTVLTEDAIHQFLSTRLAGYKLPRLVCFVEALPLTASGKVARQKVIDLLVRVNETGGG